MGFFNFLKKEREKEKVTFEGLEDWINKKKHQLKKDKEDFLGAFDNKLSQLILELEEEIDILEKIDLSEKKEGERIKLIVTKNLSNYISYLKKLIGVLKNLEKKEVTGLHTEISSILLHFEETSKVNYEKATFLIGKELSKTKSSLMRFFNGFENLVKKNKDLIMVSEIIKVLEGEVKEINKFFMQLS